MASAERASTSTTTTSAPATSPTPPCLTSLSGGLCLGPFEALSEAPSGFGRREAERRSCSASATGSPGDEEPR